MLLSVVTPEKRMVLDEEIDELIVPGEAGQLDILPGHAPLVTTLQVGTLRYRLKGTTAFEDILISWGYCEVNPQGILILAETAETKEQIDIDRAEQSFKRSQERLLEPDLEPDQIKKYRRKMDRARARMDFAKLH